MDRLIAMQPINVERVASTAIYPLTAVDPQWSVAINPTGTLVAHYDQYDNANGGATHAILFADKYIKGVGPTPLASDGQSGWLSMDVACREAMFTHITHQRFNDAPALTAVLEKDDGHCLLVRDMPVRLAHIESMAGTPQEKMNRCKALYNLSNLSDADFCDQMFYTIINRLSYWFFRRVQFGRLDFDAIDIFGNMVRHTDTQTYPDFANVAFSDDQAGWAITERYAVVIHFMLDNFIDDDLNKSVIADRYSHLIQDLFRRSAIELLGVTRRETNLLYSIAPELVDLLGQAIIAYLEDELSQATFRDDFTRILKNMTTSSSKADVIASHYRKIGRYIPVRTSFWLENCRNANTDISRNVNIALDGETDARVMASKIDLGQLIFTTSIGKEAL